MEDLVRSYYQAIDTDDYDALADVLGPDFTHDRPDRSIEGRETFVEFMREQRPETETTHTIETMFRNEHGIAVQGILSHDSGEVWFEFVDVFSTDDNVLTALKTYTDSR